MVVEHGKGGEKKLIGMENFERKVDHCARELRTWLRDECYLLDRTACATNLRNTDPNSTITYLDCIRAARTQPSTNRSNGLTFIDATAKASTFQNAHLSPSPAG